MSLRRCLIALLSIVAFGPRAWSQVVSVATLVGTGPTALINQTPSGDQVAVAGYFAAGDGGGGAFVKGTAVCGAMSVATSATWSAGDITLTLTNPLPSAAKNAYIDPTSGGGVAAALPAAFDKIVNRTSTSITLETPVPAAGSTTSITYTAANGGSTLRDKSGNCYDRVNSTYSPKEWGAQYSSSSTIGVPDDTVPLQNWLDAPQPHIAVPGYTYITAPLICNANPPTPLGTFGSGIIQGPPTQAVAEDNTILPTFYIMGDDAGFHGLSAPKATTTAAMLVMPLGSTCAIHSIGLIATDTQTSTASYDIVDAQGKSDLIDSHSFLQGGYYNLKSGASGSGGANLEVYDSSLLNAFSDNALIFSPNAKIVRNSFAGAGMGYSASNPVSGSNISFGSSDILIADNILQQAAGWAIDLHTARSVRIANNFFDNNGKQIPGTGGLRISNTGHVTICGNTFAESGAASLGGSAPYSAHVTFAGSVDSVSLCGNTYLPIHPSASSGSTNTDPSVVLLRPDFDFDVDATSSPLLTNISINDNPAPQNVGVMSPSALLYMPGAIQQPFPRNYLTGLGLIYGGTSTVSINTGTAMDQSSTTPITLSSPCLVDLTKSGAGGLDTGSVQAFKTYFFYVISGPSGANPSCMASASNTTPTFVNTGTTYKIPLKAMTATNSTAVYNVGQASGASATSLNANPLGGILPNDTISSPGYINSTSIASLLPYSVQSVTATAHTGTTGYLDGAPFTGVFPGMGVGGPLIPGGTVVTAVNPGSGCTAPCVTLSQSPSAGGSTTVNFGGNYTINIPSPGASATTAYNTPTNAAVLAGRYRMVGALLTTGGPSLVPFKQDGDTFYLAPSISNIPGGGFGNCPTTIGTTQLLCALSVPCGWKATCSSGGIQVEAFGRMVAANAAQVLASSPDQAATAPSTFPGPPGYSTKDSAGATAFPFRLYTDTSGEIAVQSSTASTTVNEVTEGWRLRPGP